MKAGRFILIALFALLSFSCKRIDESLTLEMLPDGDIALLSQGMRPVDFKVVSEPEISIDVVAPASIRVHKFIRTSAEQGVVEGEIRIITDNGVPEGSTLTVTFTNGYRTESRTYTLESYAVIAEGDGTLDCDFTQQNISLPYRANDEVEISVPSKCDWIQVLSTKALESHNAAIAVAANSDFPREAVVSLRGKDSGLKVSYTIRQGADMQTVLFTHQERSFHAPQIFSSSEFRARVYWGDAEKSYLWESNMRHDYTDAAVSHTVRLETIGADKVNFPSIRGIDSIDLTNFR